MSGEFCQLLVLEESLLSTVRFGTYLKFPCIWYNFRVIESMMGIEIGSLWLSDVEMYQGNVFFNQFYFDDTL